MIQWLAPTAAHTPVDISSLSQLEKKFAGREFQQAQHEPQETQTHKQVQFIFFILFRSIILFTWIPLDILVLFLFLKEMCPMECNKKEAFNMKWICFV